MKHLRPACTTSRTTLRVLLILGTAAVILMFPRAMIRADDSSPATRESTYAITSGRDDDGDPAVVALMLGGHAACSGVVIAPRVVLTAAHCLPLSPIDDFFVFFGNDATSPDAGLLVRPVEVRRHPDFRLSPLENDIGLLLLASDAPAEPLRLASGALTPADQGASVRLVGFGHSDVLSTNVHRKREGATRIARIDETTFTFHPEPSQTCIGDSGGPALLATRAGEEIIGVASFGDPYCQQFGVDTRVDVYRQSFIERFLRAATTTAEPAPASGCSLTHPARGPSASSLTGLLAFALLFVVLTGRKPRQRTRTSSRPPAVDSNPPAVDEP